jgi:hypothetical protein
MEYNNEPVSIGDNVRVTLVGENWGIGQVKKISTNSHGGSILFPAFCIKKENEELWVPPISIEKVG